MRAMLQILRFYFKPDSVKGYHEIMLSCNGVPRKSQLENISSYNQSNLNNLTEKQDTEWGISI
jgi:hypothetical protein